MSRLSKEALRKLIKVEMRSLMDEDALFVQKDIPGDADLYQDYSLDHLHHDSHDHDIEMNMKKPCGCDACVDCGHEGQSYMARPQLAKIAKYASELLHMIQDGDALEDWQESHIAQIADDMAEVYHSIEYDVNLHHNDDEEDMLIMSKISNMM